MKILITGTTGYIGMRLIPVLLQNKHELVCCVRDLNRIPQEYANTEQITFIEVDFLKLETLNHIPKDIQAAYYLIHSMSADADGFETLEEICATNFTYQINQTECEQVIYLSGIVNDKVLSKHLGSRKKVEDLLNKGTFALTTFKAGIIVGSGSASFEIIRDLVEKLPVMITPKWLNTKTQPIGVADVIQFLSKGLSVSKLYNQSYDIMGPEIMTYKEMLLQFARVRNLKRWIITVPVMTPRLSSYWLYFVTTTTYSLASSLVDSMKVEVIGKPSEINQILGINPMTYTQAVEKAFEKIEQNAIVSSWKDAVNAPIDQHFFGKHINPPKFGCFKDIRVGTVTDPKKALNKIWSIGGNTGWYYGNFLWEIRGFIDLLYGGVGLRRGRTHDSKIQTGDVIDFWRVLYANKKEKKLLLYAEMKLPGEAWLEFKIIQNKLYQRAIFRPKGLYGRLYWYAVLPFHGFIFNGMLKNIIKT
ncbi:SDR family oxidoreductase [Ochrovirga pacifica]|uniref:SDR family oxidoreductase n=1 Tax=Ochrovirga pacifica TaxID=1042376 RepID=UPI0002558B0D|nr:SDR family oxidoreductase [Ochrovirga pacifica]